MVSIGDVDRWNPDQVREVFAQIQKQLRTIDGASQTLAGLPVFGTWGGPAADAAKHSVGKTVQNFKGHAAEIKQVGIAANDTADQIQSLKHDLATMRDQAAQFHMQINGDNSVTGQIFSPWSDTREGVKAWNGGLGRLKNWVKHFLEKAEQVDEDLAAAIEGADGVLPVVIDKNSDTSSITRVRNRKKAFYEQTGRWPTSDNDWRMAAMLDPHNYDPKYRGVKSSVQVKGIKRVKNGGIQWVNAFIPRDRVHNIPNYNAGDARGYDPHADPEHSRVSIGVDYDNGFVVMRQNPSIDMEHGDVKVGKPTFGVVQDGKDVQITFEARDPYSPLSGSWLDYLGTATSSTVGETVRGDFITHAQTPGAVPSLQGQVTNYPAWEVYSSPTSHNDSYGNSPEPDTVYTYMPNTKQEWGPALHLPGHHNVKVP